MTKCYKGVKTGGIMLSSKRFKVYFFSLGLLLALEGGLNAQGSSSIPSGSPMQSMPLLQPPREPERARPAESYRPRLAPVQPISRLHTYFYPGILVSRNGQWEGSDHLLNISNQIGIYVEIIRPETDKLEISKEQIYKKVETVFNQAGIATTTLGPPDQPALPAFQVKIFLFPIDRGYAAYCEGRLFESVDVKRFILDPGMAFQAVTWQRQSLIVAPTDKIIEQIDNQVMTIAQSFAELFQIYERRKQSAVR